MLLWDFWALGLFPPPSDAHLHINTLGDPTLNGKSPLRYDISAVTSMFSAKIVLPLPQNVYMPFHAIHMLGEKKATYLIPEQPKEEMPDFS